MSSRFASLAILAGLTVGAPAVALADDRRPQTAHVAETSRGPMPAPPQDAAAYAEREAKDKEIGEFEGGQTVVLVSGTAIILLILLLMVI